MISALFGCAVLVDVLLTGTLIVVLLRSRTGFRQCVLLRVVCFGI